jgi:hypothetical protein
MSLLHEGQETVPGKRADRELLRALEQPRRQPSQIELLSMILDRLDRLDHRFDEWAGADLNGRFPYGDGLAGDRWSRRRR